MSAKIYSFRDEEGHLVKYTVKERLLIDQKDYVIMSPEDNSSSMEVYRFNFENGNESLELVENQTELSKIKSISKVM